MAATGIQFPWWWDGGTISTILDVIWGMSAKCIARDVRYPVQSKSRKNIRLFKVKPKQKALLNSLAHYSFIILGSVFFTIFLFFVYKWHEFARDWIRIAFYYTLPLLFSLTCFLVAWSRMAQPISYAFLLFIVFVFCMEFAFGYADTLRKREVWNRSDKRSTLAVTEQLRSEGIDAWPAAWPESWIGTEFDKESGFLPLGGISGVATVYCGDGRERVIYESDRFGFFNTDEVYVNTGLDILLIGDSYVQGYCVGQGEGVAALIRQVYPSTANMGMNGNGPLIELAVLREYGRYLRPKTVILFYFSGNDLLDLEKEKESPFLKKYIIDSRHRLGHPEHQSLIDSKLRSRIRTWRNRKGQRDAANAPVISVWDALNTRVGKFFTFPYVGRFIGIPYGPANYDYDLFKKILQVANTEVVSWGGELVVVYIPYQMNLIGLGRYSLRLDYSRKRVLEAVRSLGIPLIDLYDPILEAGGPLAVADFLGAHLNSNGYKVVAHEVLEYLRQRAVGRLGGS